LRALRIIFLQKYERVLAFANKLGKIKENDVGMGEMVGKLLL
jgi:hypothetical protein